jgi:hypothetical protein
MLSPYFMGLLKCIKLLKKTNVERGNLSFLEAERGYENSIKTNNIQSSPEVEEFHSFDKKKVRSCD